MEFSTANTENRSVATYTSAPHHHSPTPKQTELPPLSTHNASPHGSCHHVAAKLAMTRFRTIKVDPGLLHWARRLHDNILTAQQPENITASTLERAKCSNSRYVPNSLVLWIHGFTIPWPPSFTQTAWDCDLSSGWWLPLKSLYAYVFVALVFSSSVILMMQLSLSLMLCFLVLFLYHPNTTSYATLISTESTGTQSKPSTLVRSLVGTASPLTSSNGFYSTASAAHFHGMSPGVFPPGINVPQSVQKAQQCWSQIMTWTSSSLEWYSATVANRAWPLVTTTTLATANSTVTTTIYPTNVSTYTLCDGSARVDLDPVTSTITSFTTMGVFTHTSLATPTFEPQPCEPSQRDCYIWYHNSNASTINEDALLNLCGNPVHGNEPCVFAIKDAVELLYFPVTTVDGDLCAGNGSTIQATPTISGQPNTVSALGRIFTSGKVYLSMASLFATEDGYPDLTVGTPLSNFILTLESSEVSTQRSGTGVNTQINYADMNWPVPASAWACQGRCAKYDFDDSVPRPSWCNTIYQHLNPLIDIPSKITDLDPAWKTCTLEPKYMAGFWFDPPITLQEQQTAAQPTLPTAKTTTSTSAAAASTPKNPAAAITSALPHSSATPSTESNLNSDGNGQTTLTSASHHSQSRPNEGVSTSLAPKITKIVTSTFSFKFDPSSAPAQPAVSDPGAGPLDPTDPVTSEIANAPAFSILTEALSTFTNPILTSPGASHPEGSQSFSHDPNQSLESSRHSNAQPKATQTHHETQTSFAAGAVLTLSSTTITALQSSDYFIIGSNTLRSGDVATISGHAISINSGAIVVDQTTAHLTALTSAAVTGPSPTVIQAGEVLLTPIATTSNVISFAGTEITRSGTTYSYGSDGLEIMAGRTRTTMETVGSEANKTRASLPVVVFSTSSTTSTSESRYDWPTETAISTTAASQAISSTWTNSSSSLWILAVLWAWIENLISFG
ncbi:uncharacterized protein MYCFIDRAFT_207217 [Pseudocercospora fijiensis CIRAD86]|uniref:Uncharacterized protein n=1 Tax=Pseudocercospora fijiensis (strain CIRAD86) TaxID=383855 RepID=M2Z365_PSEFD|nr:uncharacterized protein MYCFIDRAFT_207217 [Pseudocercospora fijiensis CIRAD86]EME84255.1 hypothetical protein MYCFIDRAFT_207217 [Pseudocercospora fijiensis CIRAD86]